MTTIEDIRLARVALALLIEPGDPALWQQVAERGPVQALEYLFTGERDAPIGRPLRFPFGAAAARELAELTLADPRGYGARVVIPEDDEWPRQLDELVAICDPASADPADRDVAPPHCLWVRGSRRLDEVLDRSVAVVGTGAATEQGEQVARQLGHQLASREWTVVSGGGSGIDEAAHRGTLASDGTTVAVLAGGVDVALSASQARLLELIAEHGLLISEATPGWPPFRERLRGRSRLVAAFTRGTLAVESAACGSAQQTLRRAGQLGRPAMAVPDGPVTIEVSRNPATSWPVKIISCPESADPPAACRQSGSAHTAGRDRGTGGAR